MKDIIPWQKIPFWKLTIFLVVFDIALGVLLFWVLGIMIQN